MSRILIAEDDEKLRRRIREYLKMEGYQVTEAADGEEAGALWQEVRPELILLDWVLPKGSGMEVLKRIRKSDWQTPILMLTAAGDEQLQLRAFEAGADDYVIKPVSIPVLIKRVQSLLRRSSCRQTEKTAVGGLTISQPAYQAWWHDRPLILTPTEFDLLWVLVMNRGQVLTRLQLLDQVWGYDYLGEERVVDAHIKNLRRKLPVNLIRTVKGRGYTFDERESLN